LHKGLKTALDYGKSAAVIVAIVWGLIGLNALTATVKDLSNDIVGMQDQYVGLQLANADLIKTLVTMKDETAELRAIVSSLNEQIRLQSRVIEANQVELQKQIDSLVKFLTKTYPEHKAELQSFKGRHKK
tara:strand:+ start:18876 stop:19265 length:390 start_codon:yes stop_codon:yes gene_type:complete